MKTLTRYLRSASTALLFLALATSSGAATKYVSTTGSDANDCSSAALACATLQKAVDEAIDGDDIDVAAGAYTESGITVDKAVDIHGAGPGSTIFGGGGGGIGILPKVDGITIRDLTLRDYSQGMRLDLFSGGGGTVADLTVRNVHFLASSSRGIEIHNSTTASGLLVEDCLFDGVGVGIRSSSSGVMDGVTVRGSTFDNLSLGIYQANDGGSGFARDLHIDGCEFFNHSDTPVFAEELRDFVLENSLFEDNARGFTIFKFYENAGIDFENITIRGNTFRRPSNTNIILYVLSSAARDVLIEGNLMETDVGLVTANWGQMDVRLSDDFVNGPVTITGNEVTLSGTFGGGATAVHAIKARGAVGGLEISGNLLDGSNVGHAGGTPPTSGIYLQTQDGTFGSIAANGALQASCNEIIGFVDGVSLYDPTSGEYGNLNPDALVAVNQNEITGNDDFGIHNGGDADDGAVDAELNYWGSADGPSGAGPGSGDAVTGNVDFEPFLVASLAQCPARLVEIDLRPNNDNNQINTNARQLVPIAVLGTADFDPCAELDPSTAEVRGALAVRDECSDVDADGDDDKLLYFRARDIGEPEPEECADPDAMITLTAGSFTGDPFFGSDHVSWIGPDCK